MKYDIWIYCREECPGPVPPHIFRTVDSVDEAVEWSRLLTDPNHYVEVHEVKEL